MSKFPIHYPGDQDTILRLAWPTVITYFAFAARQFTDTWMVGQLGEQSLAALMPAQQVLYIIQGFSFGLMSALNTCGSQANRKFGPEACSEYAWQGIIIALVLGSAGALLTLAAEPLFGLLGHDREVYLQEVAYFEISVFAFPAQFMAGMLANFFFAAKSPLIPMCAGIGHVILNIVFNYLLMFGVPGFIAPMGIAGAAWGTVLASAAWALWLIGMFLFLPALRPYRTWIARFNPRKIWDLLKIGVPNGSIDVTDTLFWNLALLVWVGQFGTEHLAASAIVFSLVMLFVVPCDGIGVALTTLVGYDIAGNDLNRARRRVHSTLAINLAFMLCAGMACWIFRGPILSSFNDSARVISIAMSCMVLLPVILALDACLYVYDNALSGAGDAVWPLRANLISNLIMIAGGGWLYCRYYPTFGSYGIWLIIAANRAIVAIALSLRWASGAWRHNRPISDADDG